MTISNNKAVTVSYYLTASKDNGPEQLVEETSPEHPLAFLFGHQNVLPDFEAGLIGKQKGDKFDFRINAANAYGNYEKDYVVKIDKAAFEIDGKFDDVRVKVGAELPMNDSEGNPLSGIVLSITDKDVEMDFNHPLAGHDLHFIGEVQAVRDASSEEIAHGHIHGPGGHHH